MAQTHNPASRLYELLVAGRAIPQDRSTREALARLLHVERAEDHPLLHRRMARFFALRESVETQVRCLPSFDADLHLIWAPRMDQAMKDIHPNAPWATFIGRFDEHAMLSIRACANSLASVPQDAKLDEQKLAAIVSEARELANSVLEERLPPELDLFIRRHLQSIIEAIEEYPITGSITIQDALATAAGSYRLQPKRSQKVLRKSAGWHRFIKIAADIIILLNLAKNARDLLPYSEGKTVLSPPAVQAPAEPREVPRLDLPDTSAVST